MPESLPSSRACDHKIPLKEGADPMVIKAYMYPHFQKNEIEIQVKEQLQSGVIRPTTRPFTSPILLVKKKDNSWRMCVNYMAVNVIIVMDRFRIPNSNGLLDKLQG